MTFLQKLDNHPFIKSNSKQIQEIILTDCICVKKEVLLDK